MDLPQSTIKMAKKADLVSLPAEVREQILFYYFRVDGGYAYDADSDKLKTADNRPIDLSLLYTCRLIAAEARHLPLSLNAIKFTTLYRRDLSSLAGCFNLVSGTYHSLESDLTLRLANSMTPEIHAQIASKFPDFGPRHAHAMRDYEGYLEVQAHRAHDRARRKARRDTSDTDGDSDEDSDEDYFHDVFGDSDEDSDEEDKRFRREHRRLRGLRRDFRRENLSVQLAREDLIKQQRSTLSYGADFFLKDNANVSTLSSPLVYRGFARLCRRFGMLTWENYPKSFWEVEGAWAYALKLLANHQPEEFNRQVYATFPQWVGHYSAEEFLNLRFEHWAIPSRTQVQHAMDLFPIGDVRHLPGMWHAACEDPSPSIRGLRPNDDAKPWVPTEAQRFRSREKIRFSAVANAIRFLGTRLSPVQRLDVRDVVLHEDLPSVNLPSAHAQGLAPFFQENPRLRVERRVNLMNCIVEANEAPCQVAARFYGPDRYPDGHEVHSHDFIVHLSQWLLDALALKHVGIPAESFTLVLEGGSHKDYFADLFQQRLHKEVAWSRAFHHLTRNGHFRPSQVCYSILEELLMAEEAIAAIEYLVEGTTPVLRSDFNTGVFLDVDTLVNEAETKSLTPDNWVFKFVPEVVWNTEQPTHTVDYNTRLLDTYESRTD
ncbi:hypothetical protein FLONG3_5754 [Fusarium longipes]|uniref:Uncharacterized protein n=1 Tax=Fusarium longipes TaxID=694270 RepID=A0A395SSB1_9HYPO|nr:hypothetical protein FLONG3_5754 [Fusarium longipes]